MTAAPSSWTELPACVETPTVGTTGQFQEPGPERGSSHPAGSWPGWRGRLCGVCPYLCKVAEGCTVRLLLRGQDSDRGPGFCGRPVSLQLNHNKAQALLRRPSAVLVSGSLGRAAG